MFSLDSGFDIPVMSRDLGMNAIQSPMYYGGMMMPGLMPGMMPVVPPMAGLQMHPPLSDDKFIATKAKHDDQSNKFLKNSMKVVGACVTIAMLAMLRKNIIKAGGFSPYFKKIGSSIKNWFSFGKTSPAPAPGTSWWSRTKWNPWNWNCFKRNTQNAPGTSRWSRTKWNPRNWNWLKRKSQNAPAQPPAKKGFWSKLNPLNWFNRKPQNVQTPAPSAPPVTP
ncbi:MAG: hypothetical protein LBK53_04130 [Heliobacteriaceae bacterium]|jgi:hypothetical protein|nr:hypothetical protein [Heliobacteriaceae bacterium]